ncbi:MAG: DNA repair protein RecO [Planctomycetes bacterium]|nr:DNA repair protein RecO [Planctomycetota bacterium]
MSLEKSSAIIIRQADFSESSRVVTLYTREFGKVAALAKGAKRLKGPFEAALDLLAVCEVVFIRKSSSSLDLLTEAKLQQRFKPRPGELGALYAGYYIAELLESLNEDYDPHPVLFDEAVLALTRLTDNSPLDTSLLRFELVILREIGQLPMFDECAECGEPIGSSLRYGYQVSHGTLICQKCFGDEPPRCLVTPGTAAVMRAFSSVSDSSLKNLVVSPAQMRELRLVVNSTIAQILGRKPKTLRYLPL